MSKSIPVAERLCEVCGRQIDMNRLRGLLQEAQERVARLEERVETEWYNGNVDAGAHRRILSRRAQPAGEPPTGESDYEALTRKAAHTPENDPAGLYDDSWERK